MKQKINLKSMFIAFIFFTIIPSIIFSIIIIYNLGILFSILLLLIISIIIFDIINNVNDKKKKKLLLIYIITTYILCEIIVYSFIYLIENSQVIHLLEFIIIIKLTKHYFIKYIIEIYNKIIQK